MNDNKEDKTVILITVDALRPDHLNPYGYYRKTSPNLDKFTKQGTIFLNAIANGPETPSSFSNIFTSLLPYLDGGYSPLPSQKITFFLSGCDTSAKWCPRINNTTEGSKFKS